MALDQSKSIHNIGAWLATITFNVVIIVLMYQYYAS